MGDLLCCDDYNVLIDILCEVNVAMKGNHLNSELMDTLSNCYSQLINQKVDRVMSPLLHCPEGDLHFLIRYSDNLYSYVLFLDGLRIVEFWIMSSENEDRPVYYRHGDYAYYRNGILYQTLQYRVVAFTKSSVSILKTTKLLTRSVGRWCLSLQYLNG